MVAFSKYLGDELQKKLHMDHHPGTNPEPFKTIITGLEDEYALLQSTYCYPRGGGQPGDTGSLMAGDIETQIGEVLPGEMILHPLAEPEMFEVGDEVICSIHQERRNLHTQMHTAQHIVTALAEDIWGAETVGNQLSTDYSRVDILFEDKTVFDTEE